MSAPENERSERLSAREREVALLIGRGLSNKEVARELGLSLGTVKTHVHNILQKLGAPHRYSLIAHLQEGPSLPLTGILDSFTEDNVDG